ncbi:hypothetical protein [Sphingobacterium griseoflavum]|uniref:Adenylosuccinate lyase n=1 Tax=Sphingobacterium griseoflavum TaxID=1474952 RepID=A0ABQ3HWJ5_9SPHI|nr:hypothetical protein [Sphingobacterium griseoflavum]GHE41721.1 hypothetical protein GCM10017764_26140 [Sphingobacterium griseoflavum]
MENNVPDDIAFLKSGIRMYEAKCFNEDFIKQQGFTLETLLEYAFHRDAQVAFRAAWLLEHTLLKSPLLLTQIYPQFMKRLPEQVNWSCIRSFSKIGMLATKRPRLCDKTDQAHDELWIEQCFQWIIQDDCPVAVTVNCLDILYYLSDDYQWVREELAEQIRHLLKTPTPALVSRAKRILKRIG